VPPALADAGAPEADNGERVAAGERDGAQGATAASLANAPDPAAAPEEPPPLTFFGHVSNVGLAFVTSLLPSWEG
jgi:hypothetical protein